MKSLKLIIVTSAIIALTAGPLFAWGESNPRAMAIGGAYTALAMGLEASAYNPANLGLSKNHSFSIDLFSVGVNLKNNSFSLNDYNTYTGQFLTEDDKNAILEKIPAEGLQINLLTEAAGLSFSVGRLAFNFRGLGASKINLNKDPMELLLFGNAIIPDISLNDTRGEAWAIGDGTIAYGQPLRKWEDGELAIGASLHYLYGIINQKITHAEGGIVTTDSGFVGDGLMVIRSATGGSGVAFDLGMSMVFADNWIFSACWQNIYSKLNWSKDTEELLLTFDMQTINYDNLADTTINDSLVESSDTTYSIPSFSTTVPSVVKLGIARSYEKLTWALDWEQGTSPGASQSVNPRISSGIEYNHWGFLPLRAGISFGGNRGTLYSTGFGFHFGPYQFDMAIANSGSIIPGKTKGAAFACAMGLRF